MQEYARPMRDRALRQILSIIVGVIVGVIWQYFDFPRLGILAASGAAASMMQSMMENEKKGRP